MNDTPDDRSDWEVIESYLPKGYKELAHTMGLIRPMPPHLGAKITDISQIVRMVLYHVAGGSLRLTAAVSAAAGIVAISAVALHKWMKKLGPYLATLLQQMIHSSTFAPELWAGFNIVIADATTVQRPGSTGTTARVHYALGLADLKPRHIEVTGAEGGETARRFPATPGELWVFDRVYANPPGIAAICQQGADVIVRYSRGTLPLYKIDGSRLDVDALLRTSISREVAHERRVHVRAPNGVVIEGRLCWLRLPKDKAEQARDRCLTEKNRACDEDSQFAAEFIIVFTSTTSAQLTAMQVLELYRARWQIELEFKRHKSIGDLDQLPNFLPETIYSWIIAKLILLQIVRMIAGDGDPFRFGAVGITTMYGAGDARAPGQRKGRRAVVRDNNGVQNRVRVFDTGGAV